MNFIYVVIAVVIPFGYVFLLPNVQRWVENFIEKIIEVDNDSISILFSITDWPEDHIGRKYFESYRDVLSVGLTYISLHQHYKSTDTLKWIYGSRYKTVGLTNEFKLFERDDIEYDGIHHRIQIGFFYVCWRT